MKIEHTVHIVNNQPNGWTKDAKMKMKQQQQQQLQPNSLAIEH